MDFLPFKYQESLSVFLDSIWTLFIISTTICLTAYCLHFSRDGVYNLYMYVPFPGPSGFMCYGDLFSLKLFTINPHSLF